MLTNYSRPGVQNWKTGVHLYYILRMVEPPVDILLVFSVFIVG